MPFLSPSSPRYAPNGNAMMNVSTGYPIGFTPIPLTPKNDIGRM
jgi:hypothetical protein